jgi:hypothetical protein
MAIGRGMALRIGGRTRCRPKQWRHEMILGRNCERVSGITLGDIRLIVALREALK